MKKKLPAFARTNKPDVVLMDINLEGGR